MEQPRRRLALIGAGLLLVVVAGWALLHRASPRPAVGEPEVARVFPSGDTVLVEVLNGTSRRGLARLATRHLRRAGADVVYFGSAERSTVAATQILVRRGRDSGQAIRLRRALGVGRIRIEPDTLLRVDLTVLLGLDYQPPPSPRP